MTASQAANEAITFRWAAKGFTDDVTECGHCGRTELKGTVRMAELSSDNEEIGDMYMGVVCAARMTGRRSTEIRTEARRADRERSEAARRAWYAWSDAHSAWFCAMRDAALGADCRPLAVIEWHGTPEVKAAEAAWYAANPEPARNW